MSIPVRATTWTAVAGQLINATTGAAFVGTVTVYLQIDGGAQALVSTASGVATAAGNGTYTVNLTAAETDGALLKLTFIGTGAIPALVEIPTVSPAQSSAVSQVTGTAANRGLTVNDLILRALQDLNLVAGSDTPDPSDVAVAFIRLNDFIDDLKNDQLLVYTLTRTTWSLVPNTVSYTVGTGATISIPRPMSPNVIQHVGFIDTSLTTPYERLIPLLTEDTYAANPLKTLTTPFPQSFYYNPTFGATGFGILWPFPIPTASSLQGVIYAPTPVDEFNAYTDAILVPPGYRRFFRSQLTIEIAAAFEKQPPATVVQAAKESGDRIRRANLRMQDVGFNRFVPGLSNIAVYDIESDS